MQLGLPKGEDSAQHQLGDTLGMGLRVGQGEGAAPGAAEHLPAIDAEVGAQALDVLNQMPGGVDREVVPLLAGMRPALS